MRYFGISLENWKQRLPHHVFISLIARPLRITKDISEVKDIITDHEGRRKLSKAIKNLNYEDNIEEILNSETYGEKMLKLLNERAADSYPSHERVA